MSVDESLDIDVILNCILVNQNVRPAMLIQPADYKEATHNDPKTKHIIKEIKKIFPHLILSTDYEIYQGVIVSKTDYNGRKDVSLEEMGKILGYPCYKNFDINDNEINYNISINVKDNNNNKIQLFANICKDETNIQEFNIFANKANEVFTKNDYKDILNGVKLQEFYVESLQNEPTQTLINKLLKNEKLEQNEIDKIQNILYNFGFSFELQLYFIDSFEYNNPIHKGILLELLLKDKHDTLSPFSPLQNYPNQSKKVDEIIHAWEKSLLDILEKTSTKYHSELKKGGKKQKNKKTRRRKLLSKRKTRSVNKL